MEPCFTSDGIRAGRRRCSFLMPLAMVVLGLCSAVAGAAEKVLTIAYNEEPQTSDMQMTTS